MTFYDLWFDDDGDHWQIAIEESKLELLGCDYWAYSRGESCKRTEPVPCRIDDPGEPADFNTDAITATPIVSQRLGELLESIAPSEIQLIPARLDAPGKWAILNVLPLVEGIDYRNSVMTFHDAAHPTKPGKPRGIMRLMVTPEKLGAHHLCRLRDWSVAIIVSGLVKEQCQKSGMTNMKFVPATLSEWSRYADNPKDDQWCYRPRIVGSNERHQQGQLG